MLEEQFDLVSDVQVLACSVTLILYCCKAMRGACRIIKNELQLILV